MVWNEQVAKRDYMPNEERRALQLERLQATVQRVYGHVPFYRKALNDQDIEQTAVRSLDDLTRLPFTTRHDLLDNYPPGSPGGAQGTSDSDPCFIGHQGQAQDCRLYTE